MNRTGWKDIAEVVGFAAVVASLVFVGIETRNSTKQSELTAQALEISAYQALMSNIDDLNMLLIENPSLAALAAGKVWEEEDSVDSAAFQTNRMMYMLFRHGDLAYFMYERGAIDEARLESALSPVPVRSDAGKEFWAQRKGAFSEYYRIYMDEMIDDSSAGVSVQKP